MSTLPWPVPFGNITMFLCHRAPPRQRAVIIIYIIKLYEPKGPRGRSLHKPCEEVAFAALVELAEHLLMR
jgi:hypothetical protein